MPVSKLARWVSRAVASSPPTSGRVSRLRFNSHWHNTFAPRTDSEWRKMPPEFVADSDDEDDYSLPPSPRGAAGNTGNAAAARSSGHTSHATASTDLAFFQGVFDEQNDAAQDYAVDNAVQGGTEQDGVLSPMLPGRAARRTQTSDDALLLTSITDPTTGKGPRLSSGRVTNELTQVTTPGRGREGTEGDPWDVPSSPEAEASGRTARKPVKLSKKSLIQASHDTHGDDSRQKSRKRRKLEPSQQSEGQNDVSLVTIPGDGMNASMPGASVPSSYVVPTLPAASDSSLLVVPKSLTASQKMEYESVHLASSDGPAPDVRLLRGQHYGINLGSSGSATNVNTPRSDGKSSHVASTQPQALPSLGDATQTASLEKASPPQKRLQRLSSSPDVISMAEPTTNGTQVGKGKPREGEEDQTSDWGEGTAYRAKGRPDDLRANDEDDSDYSAPKAVQQKRPRGRPKKNTGSGSPPAANPQASHAKDGNPATKQTKKRGRPRKSVVEAEKSPPTLGAVDADAHELDSADNARDGGQPEKTRFPLGEAVGDETRLNGTPGKQTGQDSTGATTTASGCGPGELAATDAGSHGQARAGSRGPSGAGSGKPLYRVGLSKRSRIAPLLKMVRK